MQQAQQAQMLQAAQFQAQLQAQAQMRAFMQPPGPPAPAAPHAPHALHAPHPQHAPPRAWGAAKGAGKTGGPRPLTAAQRQIRDGDFQVQRAAGQKAAEQVQEAMELSTWAQKQLAKASQQAELVLEKATQSQEYQQRSRMATAEGSLEVQQQQVWMQQLSNELFNEAASIGDQILAQAESAIGTTKSAVIKVLAACDPLQALAKKFEEATRVSKSQQLAQQAEQQAERQNLPAVELSRERLQSARDDRDRGVLIAACQQVKMTVAEATTSAALVFQAVQLAHQAAPAIRTATGDGGSDGSGFYSFSSTKAVITTTVQKPLPGPEREVMPIDEHRDEIVRTIRERRVTCIQGETGCGKSSRVPQYVYHLCRQPPKRPGDEKLIVCTQPRRLAALTLSQRVAKEMGEPSIGGLVGFRISGESVYDFRRTRLLFVTTGYLLQVLVNDPGQIHKYSHIILDEAHERSVDADLLSLVLKLHIQHKLADFKLIIMSATLQGGVFSRYFQDEGDRTSPAAPIFVGVKRFHLDILYLDDLASLKSRVDTNDLAATTLEELRQRTGLFLSGSAMDGLNGGLDGFRSAISAAQRRAMVNSSTQGTAETAESEFWRVNSESGGTTSASGASLVKPQLQKGFQQLVLELVRMLGCGGEGVLIFLPGINEISELFDVLEILEQPAAEQQAAGLTPVRRSPCEFKIFILHSTIPMDEQEQAFQAPAENVCHIFLASTIAESSVTLPKVRVVIDTCLRRQLSPDKSRHGVNCLLTQWVSHASASQRSGRAGRVYPGVSIRLVPRTFYTQHMAQYDAPEIEQAPLEKLYLNVKQLSQRLRERLPRIGSLPPRRLLQLTVQPPPMERLEEAVGTLAELGALTTKRDETARITVLGRMAISLPLDLRLCRLILFGVLFGCAADAVVMATALSGQDPFTMPMSIVIKDHLKYARAVMRSFDSRWHFDAGALSEPIMLRNLFKAWLKGLGQDNEALGNKLRFTSGSSQRHVFVKHAHDFAKNHAVMPKRLTQLALSVVDVAQRTLEFLAPNESNTKGLASPSRVRLEGLLMSMGIQPERSVDPKAKDTAKAPDSAASQASLNLEELFSEDLLLLKTTLTAAFTPLYAHGIPRCMDYTSIAGPDVRDSDSDAPKKNSNLVVKADAQLAKVHTQALSRPDVEPKSFFCIPQVPETLAQQPATDSWSFSMRDLLTANGGKFKKLQVSQGQAFLTYESMKDEDGASEESEDEEIRPPDTLIQDVHEHMQLPPLEEDLSGDERRPKRQASSSESTKRKRRRDAEEAQQSREAAAVPEPEVSDPRESQGMSFQAATGEWQWSTAAAKRDESDEEQNKDEEKGSEDEREKDRRKEKERDRRKEKETKEREKKSKRAKAKKKKEESSSSESESDSSERSRRKKKKKKEAKRRKKSRSRKKKKREGACLEIESSSSGDLEIVAEEIVAESGALLALQNATATEPTEATMETAFEEVTEEQREKQRRRLERFRAMQAQAGLEGDEEEGKATKRMELKGAEGGASVLAQLKAKAEDAKDLKEDIEDDQKSPTSAGEESNNEAEAAEGSKGTKATAATTEKTPLKVPAEENNSKTEQSKDGEEDPAEEEEGSPVDVNEPDLRWERKTVPKAPKATDGPKRGVQFGGNQKAEGPGSASPESDTELFQDVKRKEGAESGTLTGETKQEQPDAAETGAESQGSDTELFQDLKKDKDAKGANDSKDEFANFLDEIKELDALAETPGAEVEALLENQEETKPAPAHEGVGLKFKEPKDPKAERRAKEEMKKEEEEVKKEEVKEEVKEAVKDEDVEMKEEMEEVKEEEEADTARENPPEESVHRDTDKEEEEKDEMDAFLDDIKDVEDKAVEDMEGSVAETTTEIKDKKEDNEAEESAKESEKANATEDDKVQQEQQENTEETTQVKAVAGEDEDMAAFLSCLGDSEDAKEVKQEDMDVSSEGKDDSTAMSTEGTPRAVTEGSTEDDFAAFLGALDEMEEKKGDSAGEEAPAEAEEESDGLDDLPVVEIKRRLRAAGGTIPDGPEDKEELLALLRETLNKPKGDAFMDFLSEIDKIHPATSGDVEMKDSAFADFLKEIDGMPTSAEAEKPAEKPLRIRYEADRRTWVVFVATGFELQEFPAESSPIGARRKALDFCYNKVKELENEEKLDEKEKVELLKLLEEVKANEEKGLKPAAKNFGLCRGLDFPSMHLLIQFGNGKNTFQWPVKVRQSFPGSRQAQSYTAEVEQKFELHRPVHPFQLAWRVCLDHGDASSSFGIGNFRSPAGLVISCPSKGAYQRLQKSQAKHAMEAAVAQRKMQQKQQRFATLLANADSEEEATALKESMSEETKVMMADAAKAELQLYTRCARRLERLAIFSGAQGREDSRNLVQLEGLTVLPNEDGSNVLPVLLLLTFFRPRTCGGGSTGGCAALCDLDSLQVRAVSMFGQSEESRWVLPITGKRKLSLDDLQCVNDLRRAVSDAFEVADEEEGKDSAKDAGKDKKDKSKSSSACRMYIKETPETIKALGLLLGAVGKRNPFDEEPIASNGEATEGNARFLGDVWIDMGEDGADDASSSWEQDHVFVRWDAPLPSSASGTPVFLSFEDLGKEVPDKDAAPEPAPKEETAASSQGVESKRFAFLPELSLSQALKDRAESFRSMQSEARELLSCGRPEVRSTKERVKHLRRVAKMLDTFQERSKSAWNAAMKAEEPFAVKQAMNTATKIMQDLSTGFAEVETGATFVREIHQRSESRKQRAESCNLVAPHIWATAVKAARLIHEKLSFHWRLASAILKHADASKRSSYKKADDTVRLVNEKLLRWKEEAEILQREAREDEMARQASVRQGIAPRMAKMEAAELARQRQDSERQRMQAMQWGRHLVQPLPMQTPPPPDELASKAAASPAEVPPPPPGQSPSSWVPPPPGPPGS